MGGSGDDTIFGDFYLGSLSAALAPGKDVLLGDGGQMTFFEEDVTLLRTIEPDKGGSDTIQGNDLDDIIMGGVDGDLLYGEADEANLGLITTGAGDDIILGDNGRMDWQALGYKGDPMDNPKFARSK
jgi:Ca2+-binding RTX toxin-like protein